MTIDSRKMVGGAVNCLTMVVGTPSMVEAMGHGRPEILAEGFYKDGVHVLHATSERNGESGNGA